SSRVIAHPQLRPLTYRALVSQPQNRRESAGAVFDDRQPALPCEQSFALRISTAGWMEAAGRELLARVSEEVPGYKIMMKNSSTRRTQRLCSPGNQLE